MNHTPQRLKNEDFDEMAFEVVTPGKKSSQSVSKHNVTPNYYNDVQQMRKKSSQSISK